jgi:hypothetical protein
MSSTCTVMLGRSQTACSYLRSSLALGGSAIYGIGFISAANVLCFMGCPTPRPLGFAVIALAYLLSADTTQSF